MIFFLTILFKIRVSLETRILHTCFVFPLWHLLSNYTFPAYLYLIMSIKHRKQALQGQGPLSVCLQRLEQCLVSVDK